MPPRSYLKELFDYNAGELFWKITKSRRVRVGEIAGGYVGTCGYKRVAIDKSIYMTHRLIYQWHYGDLKPTEEIDHIDGDVLNNNIANLRKATHAENLRNSKLPAHNKSGVKGVHWRSDSKKWRAQLVLNGEKVAVGHYNSIEEAEKAVESARKHYHGSFCRSY